MSEGLQGGMNCAKCPAPVCHSAAFMEGSPPPSRAAIVIFLVSLENVVLFLESTIAF